jgi:hypothetical protein
LSFVSQIVIATSAPAILFVDDNMNSSAFNTFTSEYRQQDDVDSPRSLRYKLS